jgi:hypothetical protein
MAPYLPTYLPSYLEEKGRFRKEGRRDGSIPLATYLRRELAWGSKGGSPTLQGSSLPAYLPE